MSCTAALDGREVGCWIGEVWVTLGCSRATPPAETGRERERERERGEVSCMSGFDGWGEGFTRIGVGMGDSRAWGAVRLVVGVTGCGG